MSAHVVLCTQTACRRSTCRTEHTTETTAPFAVNTTTKADLLSRAKAAIEAGDQSLRDAAEALAVAQELHGASQAEMARAIGKSEAWVSYFLQWRRSGYPDESPFGPKTKAGRLKHAEGRAASGAAKPRKPRKPKATSEADDSTHGQRHRCRDIAFQGCLGVGATRLAEFKVAVNHYAPRMDYADKKEATDYFLKKTGVGVS